MSFVQFIKSRVMLAEEMAWDSILGGDYSNNAT